MRNFRTSAVAAATALTVAFTGISAASAEPAEQPSKDKPVIFVGKQKETDKDFGKVISDGTKGLGEKKGSSEYFNDEQDLFYATDAFGKKTNPDLVPQWARYWIDGTVVAAIGAAIGLIIAAANFALYNGWIKF